MFYLGWVIEFKMVNANQYLQMQKDIHCGKESDPAMADSSNDLPEKGF